MKSDNPMPRLVAFAKDWDDVPTSITHVLREMGKTMPVLWINSIGTRKPALRHAGDIRRIIKRLGAFFRRAEIKENKLRVLSPFLVPKAQGGLARRLNRILFSLQVNRELKDMGNGPVEYWCSVPNAVDLLPTERTVNEGQRSMVIYYCVDDWSKFEGLDGAWLEQKEVAMLKRVHIVFTPAAYLVDKCRRVRGSGSSDSLNVFHVPHGVEYSKFARALDDVTTVPADIAGLPRPVVGFYGNIYSWIDFDLIAEMAKRRPGWSFVMIGQVYCDISRFDSISNVHFIGRREHDRLPEYCKGFNVAMIPYDLKDPRMQSVSPVKTRELLAAGVPVAAVRIPELSNCGGNVVMCDGVDDWLATLERLAARTDHVDISRQMQREDWSVRVREIRQRVIGLHGFGVQEETK